MVEIIAGLLLLTASSAWAGLGPVDPEDFLAIKPGDSCSEVSKRFGHDLRHPEVRRNTEVKDYVMDYLKVVNFRFGLIGFLLLQDPTLGIPVQGRTLFTLK